MTETQPLPDLLAPGVRLLLVGINPGSRSAALGRHFAGPSNRFWPALHAAGITPRRLRPDEQDLLPSFGVGITNLVARPSARADELSTDELRHGAVRLRSLVSQLAAATPGLVVAVLGVTAYRKAFSQPHARLGEQPQRWGDAQWWVLPNPSGLNAWSRPEDHAAWLRAAAHAAKLVPDQSGDGGRAE